MRRQTLGLTLFTMVGIGAMAQVPRFGQDPDYHNFADRRVMLDVPNFMDVVSNLPFALAGALGLVAIGRASRRGALARADRACLTVAFVGMILTAAGSAYYHWSPDNQTLVWDRAALTLAFMGFVAAMLGERIGPRVGGAALAPLVALGLVSVGYWTWTESRGAGDLRPYAFVQFFSLLVLVYLIVMFPTRYFPTSAVVVTLSGYALAKAFEVLDRPILSLTGGLISGHTLKHLAAGFACYWIAHTILRSAGRPAEPAVKQPA